MSTETAERQPAARPSRSGARSDPLVFLRDLRLALILALALLAGFLAYQAPPVSDIFVGWPGDRLFLSSSEGLGEADAGTFYGDELTGDGDRSRWTRQDAEIVLPGLGQSGDLTLTIRAHGWPGGTRVGVSAQPTVTLTANGMALQPFTPTSQWAYYSFRVPASAGAGDSLSLKLHAEPTFTGKDDPRPKGFRIDYIGVRGAEPGFALTLPPALPVALLALDGALALLALVVLTRRPTLAFVLTTLLISGAAIALALARVWAAALLPWASVALALLLVWTRRRAILALLSRLLHRYARGAALNYGLVALVAAWLAYLAARASVAFKFPVVKAFSDNFPDSLLYGLLGMGLLLLVVVRGREGLPRLSNALVQLFGSRRGSLLLLALIGGVWLGYEAAVVAALLYVGHADYADNAVVARNLVAGRGWVVDYVTQFYRLYGSVTRPQETWPLLQPVWIAPFFALFGPTAWAAKIPNLLFMAALTALIYAAGSRLWDRRVGLTAALMILTSYLFFRLVIYTTSDLAFVVFSFGAIYLFYRAVDDRRSTIDDGRRHSIVGRRSSIVFWRMIGSGILTGLMLLQKPASGGLIALGMGLWLIGQLWRGIRTRRADRDTRSPILNSQFSMLNSALWGLVALAILAPYLARNMATFGAPFYSTESRDAWVLGYGDWEDIYRVYSVRASPRPDELPSRSWVLRWGFDRTLLKLSDQVAAVRDYLAPPWKDLPLNLSDVLSGRGPLLFGMGAWLSLLGAIGAARSRRRLLTLLLAAFGPYTLFLITYWHANEERYFVVVMPWLALMAGYALWRGYDRVAAIGDGRWTPVGLVLALTALAMVISPSWPDIARKVRVEPHLYKADTDAYTWLRNNTAPGEVAMTRLPWQFNWVSERPAVMLPNTGDPELILALARHYRVRYLVRDTFAQPGDDARKAVDDLIARGVLQKAYETPPYPAIVDDKPVTLITRVYRFPVDYGGVAELQP